MSTANFHTMDNFPLYVRDFYAILGYCSSCRLIQDPSNNGCEICGDAIEVGERYDVFEAEDTVRDLDKAMDKFNDDLMFHKLSVKPGYYSGVQFSVDELYDDINNLSNSDCRYEFDLCRSATLRKYDSECRKIERYLASLADEYSFELIHCLGYFSNGEALYRKAEKKAS